jgi:hypothetical protein
MAQLNDEQVHIISERIAAGISNHGLHTDLLDHYCCFIEAEMDCGTDFESAYRLAFRAITPNGMQEIQEELFFLLTLKQQTNMKRIIYSSGFVAAFCISLSLLCRHMHYPGVPFLSITGFGALIITSTAILIKALRHIDHERPMYNLRIIVGFAAALLLSVGSIFKMLLYPGANVLIALGLLVLSFCFIPMLFYHLYKQSLAAK